MCARLQGMKHIWQTHQRLLQRSFTNFKPSLGSGTIILQVLLSVWQQITVVRHPVTRMSNIKCIIIMRAVQIQPVHYIVKWKYPACISALV